MAVQAQQSANEDVVTAMTLLKTRPGAQGYWVRTAAAVVSLVFAVVSGHIIELFLPRSLFVYEVRRLTGGCFLAWLGPLMAVVDSGSVQRS